MTQMTDDQDAGLRERESVEAWRLRCLLDAGVPVPIAEALAGRVDVDLHQALELVKRGCNPELLARILL
jgi:hypothetical protein